MYDEFNVSKKFMIPKINKWTRPGHKIVPEGLVIHWTGNLDIGSGAAANAEYFCNLSGVFASAHYTLDDVGIFQVLDENEMGYHVGTKKPKKYGPYPNRRLIGLEICVNMDGDFKKTYLRAVKFAAAILKRRGWMDAKRYLTRHYDVTGKDCPLMMMDLIHNKTYVAGAVRRAITKQKKNESTADYEKRVAAGIKFVNESLQIDGIKGEKLWDKFVDDVGRILAGKPASTDEQKTETITETVVYHMGKYFADVDDKSWAGKMVNQAHEMKLANGQSLLAGSTNADGKLVAKPNDSITRAEAVALMIRASQYAVDQIKK